MKKMISPVSTVFALFIYTSSYAAAQRSSCLRNLRILGSTPSSLTLAWEYACAPGNGPAPLFKVYYEHMEWKACPTGNQDETRSPAGRGNTETEDYALSLEGLHPYSAYKLTVKAILRGRRPEEAEMVGETPQGDPGVAPARSSIPPRIEAESIKFYWTEPARSGCRDFNGVLDGVTYVLKGTDLWNQEEEQRGHTSEGSHVFHHLRPHSSYALFLYAQNTEGRHNDQLYLKMEEKTRESEPGSPRQLEVLSQSGEKRLLQWLPPYPPTGTINFYTLRWKPANATGFLDKSEHIFPSDSLCPRSSLASDLDQPVCHTVQGLNPDLNYTFEVAATNEGIPQRSPWSAEILSLAGAASSDSSESSGFFFILAIVGIIAAVLLLLILCFIVFKYRQRQARYKNVPEYDNSASKFPTPGASVGCKQPPQRMTSVGSGSSLPGIAAGRNSNARGSMMSTATANTTLTNTDTLRKYSQHLLPPERQTYRPRSIQETPLPEVPV